MEPAGYNQGTAKHPDLLAAIQAVATQRRTQQTDAKTLWMQRRKGSVIDGVRFAAVSNPKGGSKWWVEDVNRPRRHDDHQDDLFPGQRGRPQKRGSKWV
jgi:hypothetical protein